MSKLHLISLLLVLLSSCVSKKKYNALLQEKTELEDKSYRLSIMNSDLTRVSEEMAEDYKTAMKNLSQLEREYNNYKKANPRKVYGSYEIPEPDESLLEESIFTVVEKMPEYPGGQKEMMNFLVRNINYPSIARENDVQGRVYVQFVVEKDGSIGDIKVIRGIGSGCDKESIRVVSKMPKWEPGTQRGKKVRVKYVLPISFKLG